MKKKLFVLLLSAAFLLSLAACGEGGGPSGGNVVKGDNWGEYIDMSVLDDFE